MERRLAAILAADVVGYSRLMAADEKGTHARLTTLRKDFIEPKIAEHHGRIVKLMGDGALVEFASVVDAVECAAAIQAGVAERQASLPVDQRIAFRVGINIGDVIIEEGDIYGDAVNVAARLEGLAEPGENLRRPQRVRPGQGQGRVRFRAGRRAPDQEHPRAGHGLSPGPRPRSGRKDEPRQARETVDLARQRLLSS